jgi:hypothetical protein
MGQDHESSPLGRGEQGASIGSNKNGKRVDEHGDQVREENKEEKNKNERYIRVR